MVEKNLSRFYGAIRKEGVVFFLREGVWNVFAKTDLDEPGFEEFQEVFREKWIDFYQEVRKTIDLRAKFFADLKALHDIFRRMPGERRFIRGLVQMIVDDPKTYMPLTKRISSYFLREITPESSPLSPASLYDEEYN